MHMSVPLLVGSLFYVTLIAYLFFSRERIKTYETKLYSVLLIVDIVGIALDIIGIFSHLYLPEESLFRLGVVKLYLLFLLAVIYLLTIYIYYSTVKKSKKRHFYVLSALYAFLGFISLFLPFAYFKDGNNVYVSGPNCVFVYAVVGISMIGWIIYLALNRKKIKATKYIPIVFLILFIVPIVMIQMSNPEYLLVTALVSFIVVFMYHTIENPDVKMIEALNEAKITAEKANRAKSEFLSNMSHEIRTPLNAIVGFSDCIIEEDSLQDAQEDAKDIKLASENLLEIVNGILDISKIEANKMEIVETEYEILPTLDNVVKLVKPRLSDKPIDMLTVFAPDIPHVLYGDGGKLRQIITNLLTNAAKYTEKGKIILSVNCVNEGEYSKLILSVEDTGRGIKKEQMESLFSKFQRLDEDKNTTLEGTGLGLAITKKFVEMMGGKIVVQSKYGEGSKFTVYLQQKIVQMNDTEEKEELINTVEFKRLDFSTSRVLVVDDNHINLKVAQKLLTGYGITVDVVESGYGALDKLNSNEQYDLLLLDVMMPKMDGIETLKHIREDFGKSVPVVALTANALSGMKEKYIEEGFDDYLSKPIDKSELYRILVTFLIDKIHEKKLNKSENELEIPKLRSATENLTRRVLIVDDNKINIKIAEKLLERFDFLEVESVLSGKEALEKVQHNAYDLVFMDIMMPEMDGVETLKQLRAMHFDKPVVTLTADAVEGSREKYLSEGFDEYIAKPVSIDKMQGIIDKFLR